MAGLAYGLHAHDIFGQDASVEHIDDAACVVSVRLVVSHHDYRRAVFVELIEQVQHTGDTSVANNNSTNVRLTYNHPVKELVWCFANTIATSNVWDLSKNAVPLTVLDTEKIMGEVGYPRTNGIGAVEEDDGPLKNFNLVLNGQDRFKAQGGKYFNQVQPFYHHSGAPQAGVYSYSFALKPEEHQPTGTCNFSRIDNAQASIELKNVPNNNVLSMFAVNYNVLRVQSGMGGLAFSN